jgi:hypothetical protein
MKQTLLGKRQSGDQRVSKRLSPHNAEISGSVVLPEARGVRQLLVLDQSANLNGSHILRKNQPFPYFPSPVSPSGDTMMVYQKVPSNRTSARSLQAPINREQSLWQSLTAY